MENFKRNEMIKAINDTGIDFRRKMELKTNI